MRSKRSMSRSVRCLLDKAAARRTLEGLLRLAEGREEEQLWAVDLLQRAKEQSIQLFVTIGTINILSQLEDSPRYSAVVGAFWERVVEAQPTRYFKRWTRRLREFALHEKTLTSWPWPVSVPLAERTFWEWTSWRRMIKR